MSSRTVARLLHAGGTFAIVAALSKFHATYVQPTPYDFTESFRFVPAVCFGAFLLIGSYAAGLPDRQHTRRAAITAGVVVPVLSVLLVSMVQLVVGTALLPRFVVLGSLLLLIPWYILSAFLCADLSARSIAAERVLVVGELADVSAVVHDMEQSPERLATLVDVVPTSSVRSTHRNKPLVDLVTRHGITVLVLDAGAQADASILRQAGVVHASGVRVRSLLGFYEQWLGKLPVSELERLSLMFDLAEVHSAWYGRTKRLVDIASGALLALAFVASLPFVLLGNALGNRGPLFFTQPRVGKNGKEFRIFKYRTMTSARLRSGHADELGHWTTPDDERVTPFGRLLRRFHVDELPQAINILRGDLSIVGPRPEQPVYVEELIVKLPFYRLRHCVRPGLTGWAQVKYGYAASTADAMEKLQYEFFYLSRQSLVLDLRIMVRTLRSMVGGAGSGR